MTPQFIHTEGGEELVVLTRRAYDALLARLGDEGAADRATARMVDDYLAEKAAGGGASVPHWFATAVAKHGSGAKAARRHAGLNRRDAARDLDIPHAHLTEIERGRAEMTEAQRRTLADLTGIEAGWLV